MSKSFAGRSILITGAAGLIGGALVQHFLARGAKVVAQVHHSALAVSDQPDLYSIRADLADPEVGNHLVSGAIEAAGSLHFVINNAARQDLTSLRDARSNLAEEIFQVNVLAVGSILAAASRVGVEAAVNLSSIEASTARAGHAMYGASKAALEALTRSSAAELAPMRINALRLGLIGRPGIENDWPEGVASWKARAPLGRYGTPREVAEAIEFLLSSTWCTGAILSYDGGMSAVTPW